MQTASSEPPTEPMTDAGSDTGQKKGERGMPKKKKKYPPKRCALHNRVLSTCPFPECGGGSALCKKHKKIRSYCPDPECGGGGAFCQKHKKLRTLCPDPECGGGGSLCKKHRITKSCCPDPECGGGGAFCQKHNKLRSRCPDPDCGGGTSLCEKHRILRSSCLDPDCGGGGSFCQKHKRMRSCCPDPECGGGGAFCQKHKILRSRCPDPECGGGGSLCEKHKVVRSKCTDPDCGGGSDWCIHKKHQFFCRICSDCGHGTLKVFCGKCPDGGRLLCPTCPRECAFIVKKGKQCSICKTTPWQGAIREREVGSKLMEWADAKCIPSFTSANKVLRQGNITRNYRPDFFYDCGSFAVIIEVDEDQHDRSAYNPNCELTRMYSIAQACAIPTIFLRFNPDSIKINGLTERVPKPMRHAILLEVLKEHLANGSQDFLTISYLYYSQPVRLIHGETRAYVTTQRFKTEVDYETHVGALYPQGCGGPAQDVPWFTRST